MKKFSVLLVMVVIFTTCEDATDLKPDIEITWMNPMAAATWATDTTLCAMIEEVGFVPRN